MDKNNQNNKNNHDHPPFRYFHSPHSYLTGYIEDGRECDVCHQNLPGYEIGGLHGRGDSQEPKKFYKVTARWKDPEGKEHISSINHEVNKCESINFICEKCLTEGKLKEVGCQIMGIDRGRWPDSWREYKFIQRQLKVLYPELSDGEIKKIADEKTDEIEYRTPKISSWQEFTWPIHCADYCCFIGEMAKEELNNLSPDKNGRKFLDSVMFEDDYFWEKGTYKEMSEEDEYELDDLWIRFPNHAPKGPTDPTSCFLLFQCLTCGKYLGMTDFA